jgi:peptidoglycan hydrolase CwlO-like protein
MRGSSCGSVILSALGLFALCLGDATGASGQSTNDALQGAAAQSAQKANSDAVDDLLRQLQSQLQELRGQVKTLQEQQQSAQAESAELRKELDATKTQLAALAGNPGEPTTASVSPAATSQSAIEERLSKLEENQQMAYSEAAEQSQTKVESSSKYRLRLSGMVLLNMYADRGSVNNQDFPELAFAPGALSSGGTFGGSLRQSEIALQGFGPTIAGARTSAEVHFDFAGGFPQLPNGDSYGIMRLRTGTVRFDWDNTSIIAGQDALFLAPLSATSIATLAVPAFAYAGDLWSWTPQIRVEHRFTVSDHNSFLVQGGILDNFSGDTPVSEYNRYPTWGENSGQPAYATRLAWTQNVGEQKIVAGVGGYYGRQNWGFGRTVDAWAGTADLTLPLGNRFEFTGQFYRGRAVGGIGGGIAQTGLWDGVFTNPATEVYGLDSIGGWAQLKYKATSKLQFNGAFGTDNPFASDFRQEGGSQMYYPSPLAKNEITLANFLYQPKSDIVFSLEYRHLKTYTLDSNANTANITVISVGYIF